MTVTTAIQTRPTSPAGRNRARLIELVTFGGIGAVGFVLDVGSYNLLRLTVLPNGPIEAKVISVILATVVTWLGNRYLTFRHRRGGGSVLKEAALFALINLIGLLIAAAALYISHYVLGYRTQLDDNISGNGAGLILGTTFRFLAYRLLVFRPPRNANR